MCRVSGADNSQRAHDSRSEKLKSGAAAAIPRSRSPQRSCGKYRPVCVATNSLSCDNNEEGNVGRMFCLKREMWGACFASRGFERQIFRCPVFQRLVQRTFFFQRKKFVQVVDEDQAI